MKFKEWTPIVLRNHCIDLDSRQIGFGDESVGALRKQGFRSTEHFRSQQKQYRDAMFRLATDQRMESAWEWLISNDTQITAVAHIKGIAVRLFSEWRKIAEKNKSERREAYKKIQTLAKDLSLELLQIEFEEDTPLNEINIYLMDHQWLDQQPKTRRNIHSIDYRNSNRLGSLIATAQNLPSLSVLVERIGRAAKQAAENDKTLPSIAPRKIHADSAFRTFSIKYLYRELNKIWEDVPTFVLVAITGAICDDVTLDESHAKKLVD